MSRYWLNERWRTLLILSAGAAGGWYSGYWASSFLLVVLVYVCWHISQFNILLQWLRDGADTQLIPDLSGPWELAGRYIYRIQRRNQQRKTLLRNLLDRFEQVAIALPDAVVVLRPNNEIEWANSMAEVLLGIKYSQDVGQRIDNLIRDPDFHRYLNSDDYRQPLELPSPEHDELELNIRIIRFGDGERLLAARDISSLVRVQTMRRDFVANVSHELRTPLTVMNGYLETLLDVDELTEDYRRALLSIQQQSDRMQQIVEGLLELSRLESDPSDVGGGQINVPAVITALLSEAASLAEASQHEFVPQINTELHLLGEEQQLISLFTNLIHNALRHTSAGTRIEVHWQLNSRGAAVFAVVDNGPGIEPEHLPRLTERFYRVDAGRSRDHGGTGLGLSIVKHIMLRHSGELQVDSVPDQSTSFTCVFPASRSILLDKTPAVDTD